MKKPSVFVISAILIMSMFFGVGCKKIEDNVHVEHSLTAWVMETEPSITTIGSKTRSCQDCSYKITEELPKLTVSPTINYALNSSRTAYVVKGVKAYATQATIYGEFNSFEVAEIAPGAFYENKILQEVRIDEGIKKIGGGAFIRCTSLQEIKLPNSLESISANAFNGCEKIESIELMGVKDIGSSAFYNCTNLLNIAFGEKLERISSSAFYGCAPQQITLPSSLSSVGSSAFKNCSALENVIVSDNTQVHETAFVGTLYNSSLNNLSKNNNSQVRKDLLQTSAKGVSEQSTQDFRFTNINPMVGANENQIIFTYQSGLPDANLVELLSEYNKQEFFEAAESGETALKLTYYHTVADIVPGVVYKYRVGNGTIWSNYYDIATIDTTHGFTFIAAGDPQIGSTGNEVLDAKAWGNSLHEVLNIYPKAAFALTVGDQVENGNLSNLYTSFKSPKQLKSLPLAAVAGNHEALYPDKLYSEHYYFPNMSSYGVTKSLGKNSGDYYFSYGNVLFLMLNSNTATGYNNIKPDVVGHKAFINETLEKCGDDFKWKIVAFHHSLYSSGVHYSDVDTAYLRSELAPFLSEKGIIAALGGHDHVYTRSKPMNGNITAFGLDNSNSFEFEDNFTTYLTLNSAGRKFGKLKDNYNHVANQRQTLSSEITAVNVTPSSLEFITYDTENNMEVKDSVKFIRDNEGPVFEYSELTEVEQGTAFDYKSGVKAYDYIDGEITSFNVLGSVDTDNVGQYYLTYSATDLRGNTGQSTRLVTVKGKPTENKQNGCAGEATSIYVVAMLLVCCSKKIIYKKRR